MEPSKKSYGLLGVEGLLGVGVLEKMRVSGLGFKGLGFGFWCFGFGVWGFRVWGFGFGV